MRLRARPAATWAAALLLGVLAGCGTDGRDGGAPSSAPDSVPAQTVARLPAGDTTRVTRVVDGDTLVTDLGKIRLIGVDTPEIVKADTPVECFGPEASAFTKQLLPTGTDVRVVYDTERRDRYDRVLAYVYRASDKMFVNAALLRGGYAKPIVVPPNSAHKSEFAELARQARANRTGLWGSCPSR